MILFESVAWTKPATPENIKLLNECDEYSTYSECGWFCVSGFKAENHVICVHFNNEIEAYQKLGKLDEILARMYLDKMKWENTEENMKKAKRATVRHPRLMFGSTSVKTLHELLEYIMDDSRRSFK